MYVEGSVGDEPPAPFPLRVLVAATVGSVGTFQKSAPL